MESVHLSDAEQAVVDESAALRTLEGTPAGKALHAFLNRKVQGIFTAMLAAPTSEALFDLRGEARAYMTIVEQIHELHGEANRLLERLRADIEEARERERERTSDEESRRGRAASSAVLRAGNDF